MLAVWLSTVIPLSALHLVLWRRARQAFRFQLLFDICLMAVFWPVLIRGLDLNPIRCVETSAPFTDWRWSESTQLQPTQSDVVLQYHPWWAEVRRQLLAGEAPWISERIGGGLPVYANGQSGLLSPFMAPVWLLGPERGTTVMAFWRMELAGLGTFLLLWRYWRLRFSGAAVGGLGFGIGCYLIAWLLSPLATAAAALPWIWWATQHALRRRCRWTTLILLGALVGWFHGSGTNPTTASVVVGSSWLAGFILHPRRWLRLAAMAAVTIVVMSVLAWPTMSYLGASSRLRFQRETHPNRQPLPLWLQVTAVQQLLVPAVHGHPGRGDWQQPHAFAASATGVGGMALALIAAGRIRRRHRKLMWAGLACVAVAAVLAYRAPPLDWILVRLPPFDMMTLPRFAVLLSWGLALLAALAVDGWDRGRFRSSAWRWTVLALLLAATASTGLEGLGRGSLIAVGVTLVVTAAATAVQRWRVWLLSLMTLELTVLALGVNPSAHPSDRLPEPPAITRLLELVQRQPGRVVGVGRVLPSNLASRYGLSDLRAFDPTQPDPYSTMMARMGEAPPIIGGSLADAPARFCGAWSVRYLVAPPRFDPPPGWDPVYHDAAAGIWRNRHWLNEVRLVGTAIRAEGETAWAEASGRDIDFAVSAVVPPGTPAVAAEETRLRSVATTSTMIRATVNCDGPCLLVVARPWAPGWHARVDGETVELARTNLAGMGVVAPSGDHDVELRYNPWH